MQDYTHQISFSSDQAPRKPVVLYTFTGIISFLVVSTIYNKTWDLSIGFVKKAYKNLAVRKMAKNYIASYITCWLHFWGKDDAASGGEKPKTFAVQGQMPVSGRKKPKNIAEDY